jgi:hypothetical protein
LSINRVTNPDLVYSHVTLTSFSSRQIFFLGKSPRYPLIRNLSGPKGKEVRTTTRELGTALCVAEGKVEKVELYIW